MRLALALLISSTIACGALLSVDAEDEGHGSVQQDAAAGDDATSAEGGSAGGDADGQVDGGDAADDRTGAGTLRVFVTSHHYTGKELGAVLLDVCNKGALPGTWVAYVFGGSKPVDLGVLDGKGPWFLVGSGKQVASNSNQLQSQPLDAPIDRDENGSLVTDEYVWVGLAKDCGGWDDDFVEGSTGFTAAVDDSWKNAGSRNCTEQLRVYCFQAE